MNERTRTVALLAHSFCYVATCGYRRANGGNSHNPLSGIPPWSGVMMLDPLFSVLSTPSWSRQMAALPESASALKRREELWKGERSFGKERELWKGETSPCCDAVVSRDSMRLSADSNMARL